MLNVLLLGHPNAGKTTLFNKLTGSRYKTGNYPGVTVDYAYGTISKKISSEAINLIDTPGINSLFPSSKDEEVSIQSIRKHPKFGELDKIICVVDSTQLSRQLYIPKLLIEYGYPVTIALSMTDILKEKGKRIDLAGLQQKLNCPIFAIDYKSDKSLRSLSESILQTDEKKYHPQAFHEKSNEEIIDDYKEISALVDKHLISLRDEKDKDRSRKLDQLLLNPILGYFFFFILMGGLFTSIYWLAAPAMDFIDHSIGLLQAFVEHNMQENLFRNFLINALIGGVGAVLVFLPQIMILFFLLDLLEDSGYLSRAAVLIDAPLQKIGLSGRAFVPMLSGFACAIPAMMAARTIKDPKERFITLFIIPLSSCSARLPVYTILLSLITPEDQPWIGGFGLLFIYTLSILFSSFAAFLIHKIKQTKSDFPFALELPKYRLPFFNSIFKNVIEKSKSYLVNAGTVILLISTIMWALATFPNYKNPDVEQSYIGQIGHILEPIMEPMGLDWKSGIAIISSFAAREVFVSALVQVYRISEDGDEEAIEKKLISKLRKAKNRTTQELIYTPITIIGLIVFYIFALMCFPTVSVARKEFGNWKHALLQVSSFTFTAYILAVLIVQGAKFFS